MRICLDGRRKSSNALLVLSLRNFCYGHGYQATLSPQSHGLARNACKRYDSRHRLNRSR